MKLLVLLAFVAMCNAACPEIENCDSCENNPIQCTECGDAYVMSVDHTSCIACGTGCSACTRDAKDKVTCQNCTTGYYLKTDSCSACPKGCTSCHEVDKKVICDTCQSEHYVQDKADGADGNCVACGSNCKTCSLLDTGDTECSACYSYAGLGIKGYFLKSSDKKCKACPSNCEVCSDDGDGNAVCGTCQTGYEVFVDANTAANSGSKCVKCPTDCTACTGEEVSTNTATCTACEANEGLYLSAGECITCDSHCDTCDDTGKCEVCDEYYRVESDACTACKPWCKSCVVDSDGLETCDSGECKSGYGDKAPTSITCDSCPSNCAVCTRDSNDGALSCSTCKAGYGKNSAGTCTACAAGCETCQWSTDHMKCTSCSEHYGDTVYPTVTSSGDPSLCISCGTGCDDCTQYGGHVTCTDCTNAAHYISNSTGCQAVPTNCLGPSSMWEGDCTECEQGYNVTNSGGCTACTGTDCGTCTVALAECDACDTGYVLADTAPFDNVTDACEACGISNCDKCVLQGGYAGNNKRCVDCASHYAIRDTSGSNSANIGDECKKCPTGCDVCSYSYTDSKTTCSSCLVWDLKKAYTIGSDTAAGTCVQCPTNCMACTYDATDEVTLCTSSQCEVGYAFLDTDSTCTPCMDHCEDCEYVDGTLTCKSGECEDEYGRKLDGTGCDPCPGHCDECDADNSVDTLFCTTCVGGYFKNDDICASCSSNCDICTDNVGSMECGTCKTYYALDSSTKTCMKCPANAATCTVSGGVAKVDDCMIGYGKSVDALECKSCSSAAFSNCANCTELDSEGHANCTDCSSGYVLQDDVGYLSCISSSSVSCGPDGEYEDRGAQCTSCATDFHTTDEGLCGKKCYVCGEITSTTEGTFVDKSACTIPSGNSTSANDAESEYCTNGVCFALYNNGKVAAGCAPSSLASCAAEDGETCMDAQGAQVCQQCCTSDNCNSFVTTMDGKTDSGAASVTISTLFLAITTLVAMY